MNDIYIRNLRYLKKQSQELYNRVISFENNTVNIKKTKQGKKNLYKKIGENLISVHSSYDPILQGRTISEYAHEDDSDIILIFGM